MVDLEDVAFQRWLCAGMGTCPLSVALARSVPSCMAPARALTRGDHRGIGAARTGASYLEGSERCAPGTRSGSGGASKNLARAAGTEPSLVSGAVPCMKNRTESNVRRCSPCIAASPWNMTQGAHRGTSSARCDVIAISHELMCGGCRQLAHCLPYKCLHLVGPLTVALAGVELPLSGARAHRRGGRRRRARRRPGA
jgi:hypothetical protein